MVFKAMSRDATIQKMSTENRKEKRRDKEVQEGMTSKK